MLEIRFETELYEINGWRILRFPEYASEKLPSRGMLMVRGTMNDIGFEAVLEPDGAGSHWFRVSDALSAEAQVNVGDMVSLVVELIKLEQEPEVPLDLKHALAAAGLEDRWNGITTRARWEWIRWIRSTNSAATRQKRIEVSCSKLIAGKNRPCCFDMSSCTEPAVSKSGVLAVIK